MRRRLTITTEELQPGESHLILIGDVRIGGTLYRNRREWCDCNGMSYSNPSHETVLVERKETS